MDEEFLLAINGDWDALLAALRDNRTLAHQTDANGMTLLHWVCLHQDIPTEVLIKIVFANPHAVNVPNEAGHLPIDLAVQAECEERILEVLRAADKSRQEHEPEPAPPVGGAGRGVGVGSGRPFSPPAHAGVPYGYDYPEEEDMTFENPRYFAAPTPPQHHHHQGINGHQARQPHPSRAPAPHHQHQHHLEQEDDRYDHSHDSQYGHSNGGTPHHQHQLGFHGGRQTPTHDNEPPVEMHYGVARKPLYSIYSGQANPGELQSKSLSLGDDRLRGRNFDTMSVATEDYNAFRGETASDSHVLQSHTQSQSLTTSSKWEPKGGTVTKGSSFPPRWKQSRSCHVCASRFTLTHRRHHCRNCGFSVCGQHSTNRVPLPRFGLGEPQRVCDKCFLAGRHVFGLAGPLGSAGGARSVASGSERHYDPQPQQYGHQHHYEPSPPPQLQYDHHHYEPQPQYGARRDSFGSYRQ